MIVLLIWLIITFIAGLIWGLLQKSFYSGISLFLLLFFSPLLLIIMIIIKVFIPEKLKKYLVKK